MKLVLAGNYEQFKYYYPKPDRNIRYVASAECLIGYHGADIDFVGTWYERDKTLIMECERIKDRFDKTTQERCKRW